MKKSLYKRIQKIADARDGIRSFDQMPIAAMFRVLSIRTKKQYYKELYKEWEVQWRKKHKSDLDIDEDYLPTYGLFMDLSNTIEGDGFHKYLQDYYMNCILPFSYLNEEGEGGRENEEHKR